MRLLAAIQPPDVPQAIHDCLELASRATPIPVAVPEPSRPEAPSYVVPADNQWFTRLVVTAAMVEALDRLGRAFPKVGSKMFKELRRAKKTLEAEKP